MIVLRRVWVRHCRGQVSIASSFETKVTPGDAMVYLYGKDGAEGTYHWVNNEFSSSVDYCYAPAFKNVHQLTSSMNQYDYALVEDLLVYKVRALLSHLY